MIPFDVLLLKYEQNVEGRQRRKVFMLLGVSESFKESFWII